MLLEMEDQLNYVGRSVFEIPPPPGLPPEVFILPTTPNRHKIAWHFSPIRLHFAINKNDTEKAREIISRSCGKDLSYAISGSTPLILALLRENKEVQSLLVEVLDSDDLLIPESSRWRRQPIHVAIRTGQWESFERILDKCPQSVHSTDAMFFTPLHWAAVYNRLEMARVLIDHGVDVNALDDQGRSALHRAVQFENLGMVTLLIESGANMEIHDQFGWTPIFHSIVCGMLDVLKCLIRFGADVRTTEHNNQTPLHFATHRTAQEHLITVSKCSVDFYTRHLRTAGPALHKAVFKPPSVDIALVQVLLDAGAQVNMLDSAGYTPFRIAAYAGGYEITKLLYAAGANLKLESAWISNVDLPWKVTENAEFRAWVVEKLENRVQCLAALSRIVIRDCLESNIRRKISTLPLPKSLARYCALDDYE